MTRKEREIEISYLQRQRLNAKRYEVEFDAALRQRTLIALRRFQHEQQCAQQSMGGTEQSGSTQATQVGSSHNLRAFEPTPPAQFVLDYFERKTRKPAPIKRMIQK